MNAYAHRLRVGPVPGRPRRASIVVGYASHAAARGAAHDCAEALQPALDDLVRLTHRGFLGVSGLTATARASAPDRLDVSLAARDLPRDLIVVGLRLVVNANDSPPEDFQRLVSALDGDRDAARAVFGGTILDEDVRSIELTVDGEGDVQPFDPFHVGGSGGLLREERRLVLPGLAACLPDEEDEDLLLRLSGARGLVPLGVPTRYEPGDEEYLASGADLVIERVSIEEASLCAVLAMLGRGVPGGGRGRAAEVG